MIDDGFICLSLYTVVNTFYSVRMEFGGKLMMGEIWIQTYSALKSTEDQYCRANTELLHEELVPFVEHQTCVS